MLQTLNDRRTPGTVICFGCGDILFCHIQIKLKPKYLEPTGSLKSSTSTIIWWQNYFSSRSTYLLLYWRAWSSNLRAWHVDFRFRCCNAFPQNPACQYSNRPCLRLHLLCFCSSFVLELRYIDACFAQIFLLSSFRPSPRVQAVFVPSWNVRTQISALLSVFVQ